MADTSAVAAAVVAEGGIPRAAVSSSTRPFAARPTGRAGGTRWCGESRDAPPQTSCSRVDIGSSGRRRKWHLEGKRR